MIIESQHLQIFVKLGESKIYPLLGLLLLPFLVNIISENYIPSSLNLALLRDTNYEILKGD